MKNKQTNEKVIVIASVLKEALDQLKSGQEQNSVEQSLAAINAILNVAENLVDVVLEDNKAA